MTCLGIIGTAGRADDGNKLTIGYWNVMCAVAQTAAKLLGANKLVSGGAGFSDHVAVRLYLRGLVPDLTLHLPAPFNRETKAYSPDSQAGLTCNHYHYAFSERVFPNASEDAISLHHIAEAIDRGATITEQPVQAGFSAFFARNQLVANDSDIILSFTFGRAGEAPLKAGGSKDTMDKFLARRGEPVEARAYHYNLTDGVLYKL